MLPDSVASRDGRLRRGDRIISVNGQSMSGLTYKEALKVLKAAGLKVTLVLARKIGRRSTVSTPHMSAYHSRSQSQGHSRSHSRRGSGDSSQAGSGPGSKQGSPPKKRRLSTGSQGSSKGNSPNSSRRYRKLSIGDSKSTLPRRLAVVTGNKVVELKKGPTGVGMQLQGGQQGTPVLVKSVFPGGPAYKSGKISTGDVIVEANGISFEDVTHEQAIATMKGFPQGKVTLILRDKAVA